MLKTSNRRPAMMILHWSEQRAIEVVRKGRIEGKQATFGRPAGGLQTLLAVVGIPARAVEATAQRGDSVDRLLARQIGTHPFHGVTRHRPHQGSKARRR